MVCMHNKYNFVRFTLFLLISIFIAQGENPEWINLTYGGQVNSILSDRTNLYVGTIGGLIQLDYKTDCMTFINKANSGISGNWITKLCLDDSNNLWLGSSNELSKYNHAGWTIYSHGNSVIPDGGYISAIASDRNDHIWFSDGGVLYEFDINGKLLDSIIVDNKPTRQIIYDIRYDNEGICWIGANWGIGRLDKSNTVIIDSSIKEVKSIAFDSSGNKWLAVYGKGLYKQNDQGTTIFNTANTNLPSNYINCLKVDSRQNIWVGTSNGLARFNGNGFVVYNKDNSDLPENTIFCLEFDQEDILWIGLWNEGLVRFDGGTKWKKYNTSNSGLSRINLTSSIAHDRNNIAWLAQGKSLLRCTDFSTWETIDNNSKELLDKYSNNVYADSIMQLWEHEGIAIALIDSNSWLVENVDKFNIGGKIKKDSFGNYWVASEKMLCKINDKGKTIYNGQNTLAMGNPISKIAFDNKNNLWIGTYPGINNCQLICYNGIDWNICYTCSKTEIAISDLVVDDLSNVWFSELSQYRSGVEFGGGLSKYNSSQLTNFNIGNSDLPSNSVTDLNLTDSGNIWIGTYGGGAATFDGTSNWVEYNSKNSAIITDNIEEIQLDCQGNTWFWSQFAGLAIYKKDGIVDIVKRNQYSNKYDYIEINKIFPNPSNSTVTISCSIDDKLGDIELSIDDITGKTVKRLRLGRQFKGIYNVLWQGHDMNGKIVANGLYYCTIKGDDKTTTKPFLFIK